MVSVFSYYATCLLYSTDPGDQLIQSPRADHGFYSSHHIPDSSLTVELIRLFIATIVHLVFATHLTPSWNRGEWRRRF